MLTLQYRLSSVFGSESIVVWNKLSNLSPNENNDDDDDDYDMGEDDDDDGDDDGRPEHGDGALYESCRATLCAVRRYRPANIIQIL